MTEVTQTTPDKLLTEILKTKRAHGSVGDINFRLWLVAHIKKLGYQPTILAEGCIFVTTDAKSDTLFSAHVDTCHSKYESDGSFQDIAYDPIMRYFFLPKDSKSTCLGADDGAGIYMLLKMMEAKVPAGYLFATGEETGGIGSRAVLAKHKDVLENYSRAIAFDRAGDFEVICTQGGRVCASIAAGSELATALSVGEMHYEVSHKGSFTDTKVYADVVDECFNIGVGYSDQHTNREQLNVGHLEELLSVCLKIKWDEFKVYRKPTPETLYPPYNSKPKSFYDYGDTLKPVNKPTLKQVAPPPKIANSVSSIVIDEMLSYLSTDYMNLIEEDPELAASVLMHLFAKNQAMQAELASLNVTLGID